MAEAVGVEDTVDMVDTVEEVEPETATKVSAPIAKLTGILQMHAESGNELRREETRMSAFAASAGSQAMSKSINCVSYKRIKEWWKVKKTTATAALAMIGDCDPF